MLPTPATKGANVRTIGMKRARTICDASVSTLQAAMQSSATNTHRLGAVLLEEGLRLFQVLLLEDVAVVLESLGAKPVACVATAASARAQPALPSCNRRTRGVVDGIAQHGGGEEQAHQVGREGGPGQRALAAVLSP